LLILRQISPAELDAGVANRCVSVEQSKMKTERNACGGLSLQYLNIEYKITVNLFKKINEWL